MSGWIDNLPTWFNPDNFFIIYDRSFEMKIPGINSQSPKTPINPYPSNNAQNVSINVTLQWQNTEGGANIAKSRFYLGTNIDDLPFIAELNSGSYKPNQPLAYDTTYYWIVANESVEGLVSWGPYWSFTTEKENNPPNIPNNPSPLNGKANQSLTTILTWSGGDPDENDPAIYDVYFGTIESPPLIASSINFTSYDVGMLAYATTYYWKIVARDSFGIQSEGELWSFTTVPGDIFGTITDSTSKLPISDANITMLSFKPFTFERISSDSNGNFFFQYLQAGKYTLFAKRKRFKLQTMKVDFDGTSAYQQNIELIKR